MGALKLAVLVAIAASVIAYDRIRVCYYSNWSQYRPGDGKFFPDDIDAFLCTHLIFSFAKLDLQYELDFFEWNDEILYETFNELKDENPNLKTLLATGGWNAGSIPFSQMVTDVNLRKKFASTSVEFVRDWGFDGLDMDWEYPAMRGGLPEDKDNFIELLKDITDEIDKDAIEYPTESRLLLTAAVAAGKYNIDQAYNITEMAKYLDFINLMSYDLHGAWESVAGHNSPLYSRPSENADESTLNVDWAAKYWVAQGTPKRKLIIGLPTYGRTFQLSSSNSAIGAPVKGAGSAGTYTREAGFLAYYEICQMVAGATRKWDPHHKVPYLVSGDQWVGYDDEDSFTIKLEYIRDNGYGGAMVWNIDLDDFNQLCPDSKRRYPLMSLMAEILGGYTPPSTQKPPVTTGGTAATKATTVAPPTNPPGVFSCAGRANGFYPDPADCSAYYQCWSGSKYHTLCGNDLWWYQPGKYCDLQENVDCEYAKTTNPPATTAAPTNPPTTAAPTNPPTTAAPTNPPTTAAPTNPPTTAAPTNPPTTAAPTNPPTTAAPTNPPTTAAPTNPPTTAAPTNPPTTAAPTNPPTTAAPTNPTTTAAPTNPPTTAAPTNPPTTTAPTNPPVTDGPTNPPGAFCKGQPNGLYKKHDDCQEYYHCAESVTYVGTCYDGTLFNPETRNCDWPQNVNCGDDTDTTEFCHGMADGLYPYPMDCSKYYQCGSSLTYVQTCNAATYYSPTMKNCDWVVNVDCGSRPLPTHSNNLGSICLGDGLYPNPGNCHDFIQCVNCRQYPGSCGHFLRFNPSVNSCDWPQKVTCLDDHHTGQ